MRKSARAESSVAASSPPSTPRPQLQAASALASLSASLRLLGSKAEQERALLALITPGPLASRCAVVGSLSVRSFAALSRLPPLLYLLSVEPPLSRRTQLA